MKTKKLLPPNDSAEANKADGAGCISRLVVHLRSVLEFAERNTCTHEETHRGGAIWEICDRCGKKWADDEGGKPDDAHDLPQVLTDARDFLHSLHNASVLARGESAAPTTPKPQ